MKSHKSVLSLLLFPLQPFWAFLLACGKLRTRISGLVFVLFYGVFGYFHTFTDVRADSYRKLLAFQSFGHVGFSDLWSEYTSGQIMDVYEGFLFVMLHKFTQSPHVMMMVVGLLGGIFVYKTICRIMEDADVHQRGTAGIILIMTLVLLNPAMMGGIRYFSAIGLFCYSAIRFVFDKRSIWFVGILACPLIHFGYFLLVPVTLIARYVRLPRKILFWMVLTAAVGSLFVNSSSWSGVIEEANIEEHNEAIGNRASSYTTEESEEKFSSSLTTKLMNVQKVVRSVFVVVVLMYVKRRFKKLIRVHGNYVARIYAVTLLFLLVGFVLSSYSVVGARYISFGLLFLNLLLLNLLRQTKSKNLSVLVYMMPIFFLINMGWVAYNSYCNTGIALYCLPCPFLFQ